MADFNQFGSVKPSQGSDPQHCAQCEAMLADALDGTLSAADQATFDLHIVGCPSCATMLADAQRGAAWMEMLKSPRPEPPPPCSNASSPRPAAKAPQAAAPSPPHRPRPLPTASALQPPTTILGRPTLVPAQAQPSFASANVLPFRTRFTTASAPSARPCCSPALR